MNEVKSGRPEQDTVLFSFCVVPLCPLDEGFLIDDISLFIDKFDGSGLASLIFIMQVILFSDSYIVLHVFSFIGVVHEKYLEMIGLELLCFIKDSCVRVDLEVIALFIVEG